MTPQKKAIELVHKMYLQIPAFYDPTCTPHMPIAKQCAIIAVDEILSKRLVAHLPWQEVEYWQQVKTEIEKL